jgi:hypothetical protein
MGNIPNKLVKPSIFSFSIDKNPSHVIENPSSNGMCLGKTVDEGPEANPLNNARDPNFSALHTPILTLFGRIV